MQKENRKLFYSILSAIKINMRKNNELIPSIREMPSENGLSMFSTIE